MKSTKFDVQGMTCNGCVASINRVISAIPGVNVVDISLESGRVEIGYDESKATSEQFKQAIEAAGYTVTS